MNKKTTALIVCTVLFLVAVFLSAFLAGGANVPNKDVGGKYPYTMSTDGKSVTVKIKGPFEEGYKWVCRENPQVGSKLLSEKQSDKKAEFVITTTSKMVEAVVFSLQNENMAQDVIYNIYISLSSDPNGNVSVVNSSHSQGEKIELFASGTDMSYYIVPGDSGSVVVVLEDVSASDWRTLSDREAPAVVNTELKGESTLEVTISSVGQGECPVYIVNAQKGMAVFLDVETSSLGYAEILEHEIVPAEEAVIDDDIYTVTDISETDASKSDLSAGDIQ